MIEPLIGVLTALGRPEYDLLELAAQSLTDLSHFNSAERVGFEWVVCVDRADVSETIVREIISGVAARSTVVTNCDSCGPGLARNIALQHISAPWLLTLDGDDTIRPAGIAALLEALRCYPGATWAAGRCHHVGQDGDLLWEGPDDYFTPGKVEVDHSFWEAKLANGGIPFICNATLASTAAVRTVGGWPAAVWGRAEDTALWAVLTSRYWGVWIPEVVYYYRRHSPSMTQQPGFRELDEHLDEIAKMVLAGRTNNNLRAASSEG